MAVESTWTDVFERTDGVRPAFEVGFDFDSWIPLAARLGSRTHCVIIVAPSKERCDFIYSQLGKPLRRQFAAVEEEHLEHELHEVETPAAILWLGQVGRYCEGSWNNIFGEIERRRLERLLAFARTRKNTPKIYVATHNPDHAVCKNCLMPFGLSPLKCVREIALMFNTAPAHKSIFNACMTLETRLLMKSVERLLELSAICD